MVVSFTADCGERERGGSAKTLARDYTFRRPSERSQRCYSLRTTAVPGAQNLAPMLRFAEPSADRGGEMRLSSRIYSAIRASVNGSEIRILFGKYAIPFVPR